MGKIHLTTPMMFALGFLTTFVIGGLSGIYLGAVPIDIHASDTYFVVAHIHYVFFGGSLMTVFAGVYYWFPKMTGRMYDERLGKLHFWLTFVFFNLTFFPMHWTGLTGQPRRTADYADKFADVNLFISICSFALGASMFIFFYNMIVSWARGPLAGPNPWRALTLEWQVSSPPPVFNFDEIPTVVGGPYEYGVPGREARGDEGRHRGAAGGPRMSDAGESGELSVVLVVANETLAGGELVEAVRRRAEQGPIRAVVLAPVNEPAAGYVVYDDTRRAAAGRRLDRVVAALRDAGIPAHGVVFDGGPLDAVRDMLALEQVDELIVSTHPEAKSGWLRRNLLDEIRKVAGDRPVEHVIADVARETGSANVLVVANETVLGQPLLDRIRTRAAEGPASFLLVCPQSRPARDDPPGCRATVACGAVRAARRRHRRPRPDRAPRPVHRGDAGDPRRAGGRGDRVHLPRRAVGLAAARSRRPPARGREGAGGARRGRLTRGRSAGRGGQ